ncbi:MAG: hypothetical protein IPN38_17855 [Flavobacteriales bacterium]|nr:hypothetical protein [Flavobacteriales bacterium]
MKLFTKVRRRLLDDGRLKRYLVYAAGEIILVVIGIFIALQLNAWEGRCEGPGVGTDIPPEPARRSMLQIEIIDERIAYEASKSVLADLP